MILAPAIVQPACARVDNGNARFTFHQVSTPVRGALPVYRYANPTADIQPAKFRCGHPRSAENTSASAKVSARCKACLRAGERARYHGRKGDAA
jgi:hypothetical protein